MSAVEQIEEMQFSCTACPRECELAVSVNRRGTGAVAVEDVQGNRCPRGRHFAEREVTDPVRILTTTLPVRGGDELLVPVRTTEPIPLRLHAEAMETLRHITASAPIAMGDALISNVLGTGVDVIASMDVAEKRTSS